jgi:hypothetical protein
LPHIVDSKQALHRASEVNNAYRNILHATAGIVFLGTPFQGGHKGFYTAAEARVVVAMAAGAEVNDQLLKYMRDDATRGGRGELDEVVARFTELVSHPHHKFPIECYYETGKTDLKNLLQHMDELPQGFLSSLDSNGMGVVSLSPKLLAITNFCSLLRDIRRVCKEYLVVN